MPTPPLLIIAILAGAIGNTMVKAGTQQVPSLSLAPDVIGKALTNPTLMIGIALLVTSFPLYTAALQRLPLSIAFPVVTSGSFIVAAILSYFFLREALTITNVFGMILVIAGLWLVAKQ